MNKKQPLYRKVAKAINNHHFKGSNAKYDRNTKRGISKTLKKNIKRGLDYTPLYKFLLSKVGQNFNDIYREVIKRVSDRKAIFHMFRKHEFETGDFVRIGESSFYSKLYIDENNIIQKVNPDLKNEDFSPSCWCCTYTFNGSKLIKKYIPAEPEMDFTYRV